MFIMFLFMVGCVCVNGKKYIYIRVRSVSINFKLNIYIRVILISIDFELNYHPYPYHSAIVSVQTTRGIMCFNLLISWTSQRYKALIMRL
jgi:hypothetical protein